MPDSLIDAARELATIDDIHRTALAGLSPEIIDFLEGGSSAELTIAANTAAFESIALVPRVMSGLPYPTTATSFMGIALTTPMLTAPYGADGYFHPEGHLAVARANASMGTVSIVPEAGTFSLERVREEAPEAALIGQLHPMGSEQNYLALVERYRSAGYRALCVTCDSPTIGWRERNLRSGFVVNNQQVGGNYPPGAEMDMERALGQLNEHTEDVWSWAKLADLMASVPMPWMAKGILTPEDAICAVDAGASAVLVSNHGGRQLDGVLPSIEALPAIVEALEGRAQIALDSGIRRGSDIVKALALGADVVVLGRASLYGLAAGGEVGVRRVLDLLQGEMLTVLALLGRGGVTDLDRRAVSRR
jgi:isopentenyl diphosphate isomerase/L-lactate dehydrogenase-like FMN-dependent dehydrogenase